jgi:hypothetical protein
MSLESCFQLMRCLINMFAFLCHIKIQTLLTDDLPKHGSNLEDGIREQ